MAEPVHLGLFLDIKKIVIPVFSVHFSWDWKDTVRTFQGAATWVRTWDHANINVLRGGIVILGGHATAFESSNFIPPTITSAAGLSVTMLFRPGPNVTPRPPDRVTPVEVLLSIPSGGQDPHIVPPTLAEWEAGWVDEITHDLTDTIYAGVLNPALGDPWNVYGHDMYFNARPVGGVFSANAPNLGTFVYGTDPLHVVTEAFGSVDSPIPYELITDETEYRTISAVTAPAWFVEVVSPKTKAPVYQAQLWDIVLPTTAWTTDTVITPEAPVNSYFNFRRVKFPDGFVGPAVWSANGTGGDYRWRRLIDFNNPNPDQSDGSSDYTTWSFVKNGVAPGTVRPSGQ